MTIVKSYEDGPVLIKPDIHEDERGYFYEAFNEYEFAEKVAEVHFVQDNQSKSAYGTIRGMHFQLGAFAQAKLVSVAKGAVLDVVMDIRPDSKTFKNVYTAYLSEENHYQFFVPRGFAHGFITLKDGTIFQYKCDNRYNKENEGSFNFKSVTEVDWNSYIPEEKQIVSEKDSNAPMIDGVDFNSFRNLTESEKEEKKDIELDLEAVKERLSSFSQITINPRTSIDFESSRAALIGACAEDDKGREWAVVDVVASYDCEAFNPSWKLLLRSGADQMAVNNQLAGIKRIYYKDGKQIR